MGMGMDTRHSSAEAEAETVVDVAAGKTLRGNQDASSGLAGAAERAPTPVLIASSWHGDLDQRETCLGIIESMLMSE